jgi:hypothetical protein
MSIGEATIRATQSAAARAKVAAMRGSGAQAPPEPYSSGSIVVPHDAYSDDKVWEPSERPSIIDRQPKHPHAAQSKVQVR